MIIASILVFSISSASAYTGSYGILPSPVGGPSHITVTNFNVSTTNGTDIVIMNLGYIYSMEIETSPDIDSHILVKEYPSGQGKTFEVIVPQPLQNALVQATVYVWAPDSENLVVEHDHKGAPLSYENATKVDPEITDGNGNVLWQFTVTSFSSFTFMESVHDKVSRETPWAGRNAIYLLLILAATVTAPLVLRQRSTT